MTHESTLAQIAEKVYATTDMTAAKHIFVTHLEGTRVKAEDKKKMIFEMSKQKSLLGVYKYMTNALLAFEGMRVNKKAE
jgi:hypothetical protein